MIAGILAIAMTMSASQDVEPDPTVWYFQAAGCAGSAMLAVPEALPARLSDEEQEVIAWGVAMAEYGPRAGRSQSQVDADAEAARSFFAELRRRDPEAFEAHRAYCRSVLD